MPYMSTTLHAECCFWCLTRRGFHLRSALSSTLSLSLCGYAGAGSKAKNACRLLNSNNPASPGFHIQQRCDPTDASRLAGQGQQDGGSQVHLAGTHGCIWSRPFWPSRRSHEGWYAALMHCTLTFCIRTLNLRTFLM